MIIVMIMMIIKIITIITYRQSISAVYGASQLSGINECHAGCRFL